MHTHKHEIHHVLKNVGICTCAHGVGDALLTTVTVHYTVNALSAGKLALVFHFKCLLLFTLSCPKTIALKHCLVAFVCHLLGLLIFFYLLLFVSYVVIRRGFCQGFSLVSD